MTHFCASNLFPFFNLFRQQALLSFFCCFKKSKTKLNSHSKALCTCIPYSSIMFSPNWTTLVRRYKYIYAKGEVNIVASISTILLILSCHDAKTRSALLGRTERTISHAGRHHQRAYESSSVRPTIWPRREVCQINTVSRLPCVVSLLPKGVAFP